MNENYNIELRPIGQIQTDFKEKFGIPRQSGLVSELRGCITFFPEYRNPEALRGLEGFSHIWLIWGFSESKRNDWSPTVRPPRLGGNKRMGVFATRSPFRPNGLGLSCVELISIEATSECGTVLWVSGADLMDGTPIYDIKPYVPYADSRPNAKSGFALAAPENKLKVEIPAELADRIPKDKKAALISVLAQDPRPAYQKDGRVYTMDFAGKQVSFSVTNTALIVTSIL